MTKPKVLVVNDSRLQRELLAVVLEHAGFEVALAAHGGEALERLVTDPADVVVADLDMPVVDGWELARRLREVPDRAELPVIVLGAGPASVPGDPDTLFVRMPADPDLLVGHVRRVLGRRGPTAATREETP